MTTHLEKLASVGSEITPRHSSLSLQRHFPQVAQNPVADELTRLLLTRNGFFAFESALLLRPLTRKSPPLGIVEWNCPALWRNEYCPLPDDVVFFAEDVFGGQFGIVGKAVHYFDPEMGTLIEIAPSLDNWAKLILFERFDYWTGYTLAHEWQIQNGPLRPGFRLLPAVPFVCEGKYEVCNLGMIEDVEGMRFRAKIAKGIATIPDGGSITLTTDKESRIQAPPRQLP